ncbi:hypothetical protein N0V93_004321 [Gnomoniopsis smithogilvyi]|uniref:NAD-dependent epimerase/dehydratase domain-containing protein n=1 Tax=Gnomoniopsis smithogilvyi TaxID=1191159 RepID=A0A9W9CW33_9PEZI|nr:hypothetical protein N0V93_004321 [Gnomoniopsis smithogilvyi]
MAPKIFITGITGYIAGDAFVTLYEKHPDYEYTALVRSEEKAKQVSRTYPSVKIVIGDLDSYDLIKAQAAKNDIILHAADASDHEGAARAIAAGILEGHSKESPGFWLHTGGTGILTYVDSKDDRLGEASDKVHDDLDKVDELTSLPDDAFHRNVDKIVLEATTQHSDIVKATIVCPPTIYGKGRGPVSGRGRQVYEMAKLILTGKYIPIIGAGKSRWNNVHIEDLSDVFELLVEAAVRKDLFDELWGAKGYMLIENGEHVWSDLARKMGKEAERSGYVESLEERPLDKETALNQAGFEAVSWGLNSRGRGLRAKKFLGWQPKQHSLEDELPVIVQQEHQRLLA